MPKISLAISPFVDLNPSGGKGEHILQGLRAGILSILAHVSGMRVLAESFDPRQYPDFEGYIANGAVSIHQEQIYVLLSLNKGGKTLLTQNYHAKLSHLQSLQNKIARSLINEITGTRTVSLRKSTHQELDPQVYETYLRAQFQYNKYTPKGVERAARLYEKAWQQAPNHSYVLSGLAKSLFQQIKFGFLKNDQYSRVKELLAKAIEADPENLEAHTNLALIYMYVDKNFEEAGIYFQNAISLQKDFSSVYRDYSWFLLAVNRDEEALKALDIALEYDPLSLDLICTKADTYRYLSRFEESLQQYRVAYQQNRLYPRSVEGMAFCHAWLGHKDEAYRYLEVYFSQVENPIWGHRLAGEIAIRFADSKLFEESLARIEEHHHHESGANQSAELSGLYNLVGDPRAMEYLQMAFDAGIGLISILRYPTMESLRQTAAYKEMIGDLKLDLDPLALKNAPQSIYHIRSELSESLTLRKSQFVYAQADGNYSKIYFLQNSKLQNRLLRIKLKALEQQLEDTFIIRVHKSFLVNLQHQDLQFKGNAHKAVLSLKKYEIQIPVSRKAYGLLS